MTFKPEDFRGEYARYLFDEEKLDHSKFVLLSGKSGRGKTSAARDILAKLSTIRGKSLHLVTQMPTVDKRAALFMDLDHVFSGPKSTVDSMIKKAIPEFQDAGIRGLRDMDPIVLLDHAELPERYMGKTDSFEWWRSELYSLARNNVRRVLIAGNSDDRSAALGMAIKLQNPKADVRLMREIEPDFTKTTNPTVAIEVLEKMIDHVRRKKNALRAILYSEAPGIEDEIALLETSEGELQTKLESFQTV